MKEKTKQILQQIALDRNMTPAQVEAEMKKAIREAMASTAPHAQMLWRKLAPDGKEPTIDAFLGFCSGMLKQRREQWERRQKDK